MTSCACFLFSTRLQ